LGLSDNFFIRPTTSDDVGTVADLSARTFVSAYQSLVPDDALREFVVSAFSENKIREEMDIPGSRFLLAYEGETPVGYAFLREAGPPIGVTGVEPVELARIYFEEQVTGKGYGSMLMTACINLAIQAGKDAIWLGVWERNERAIRFYEKKGFVQVGSLPFVFGDQLHTDLVMVRPFQ
jgi:ribosomal protein S18 acetylase RimI-like enzyme